MAQSAYIKLVEGAAKSSITLDELKNQLTHYREQTAKTGEQLDWTYADAAFPYSIATKEGQEHLWFYLKGTSKLYKHIVFGVGKNEEEQRSYEFIQVVLPDDCTHGDKAKGNEFCKYLAKTFQAELQLFNGRTMYFNPRK